MMSEMELSLFWIPHPPLGSRRPASHGRIITRIAGRRSFVVPHLTTSRCRAGLACRRDSLPTYLPEPTTVDAAIPCPYVPALCISALIHRYMVIELMPNRLDRLFAYFTPKSVRSYGSLEHCPNLLPDRMCGDRHGLSQSAFSG